MHLWTCTISTVQFNNDLSYSTRRMNLICTGRQCLSPSKSWRLQHRECTVPSVRNSLYLTFLRGKPHEVCTVKFKQLRMCLDVRECINTSIQHTSVTFNQLSCHGARLKRFPCLMEVMTQHHLHEARSPSLTSSDSDFLGWRYKMLSQPLGSTAPRVFDCNEILATNGFRSLNLLSSIASSSLRDTRRWSG